MMLKKIRITSRFSLASCLVILSLISTTALSQEISLGPVSCFYQSAADTANGRYFVFRDDSLLVIDLNQFNVVERRSVSRPEGWESLIYVPVVLNGVPHLAAQNGGWVLKLTQEGWQRIDHSYDHKMQVMSAVFTSNDTLYRFGGYGFWSARNFFTWYDQATREWDIIPPSGSRVFPPGIMKPMVVISGQNWYVIEGGTVMEKNPTQYEIQDKVWLFHKDQLRWQRLGRLRANFSERSMDIGVGNRKLVIFEKEKASYYLLDIENNKLSHYPKAFHSLGFYTQAGFSPVCYRGVLYGARAVSGLEQMYLVKVPVEDILSLPHETTRLYNPFPQLRWLILGLIAALAIAIPLWVRRRFLNRTLRIQSEGSLLTFRLRKIELDERQLAVFNLLRSQEEVSSDEIIATAGNRNLHFTQNIRTKNQVIDQLNMKFNFLLNNNDKLIEVKPSKIDRRIRVYKLRKEYFD
jgi:hypothetical protein